MTRSVGCCGPSGPGAVVSFERRPDLAEIARRNVERFFGGLDTDPGLGLRPHAEPVGGHRRVIDSASHRHLIIMPPACGDARLIGGVTRGRPAWVPTCRARSSQVVRRQLLRPGKDAPQHGMVHYRRGAPLRARSTAPEVRTSQTRSSFSGGQIGHMRAVFWLCQLKGLFLWGAVAPQVWCTW